MTSSETYQELRENLASFLNAEIAEISKLPGGASSRNYYRIDFSSPTYFPDNTVLLMSIPQPDLTMMDNYVNVDYYLKRMGVATPRVYEMNRAQGWVFVEFKHLPTLEQYMRGNPANKKDVYLKLIEFMAEMQHKCKMETHCPAFTRRFDHEKYMFEFNFHLQKQLLSFYYKQPEHKELILRFGDLISTFLDISYPLFVHRDFQSSNLFYDEKKDSFTVIDFQDARFGSPVYDLVSIAWDSYIDLAPDFRAELVEAYRQHLSNFGVNWDKQEYQKYVDYSIIQRKLHDAGAFAYNYRRFGSKKYVGYISSAVEMSLECMRRYPEFSEATALLESLKSIEAPR